MGQVFLFTFNGVLIVFERRKKKSRMDKETKTRCICKQLFPASSLPVRRGASDNFPAKN